MKVIDLLNKIANGEIKEEVMFQYSNYQECANINTLFDRFTINEENLNTEIEIIDERKPKTINDIREKYSLPRIEKKKIERLQWCNVKGDSAKAQLLELRENIILQFDKINEIIDYLEENK